MCYEKEHQDFPGGTENKNPPARAGDMGLIPGLGSFHMLQSSQAHVPQLLSPCSRDQGTAPTESPCRNAEAPAPKACDMQQEKPLQ